MMSKVFNDASLKLGVLPVPVPAAVCLFAWALRDHTYAASTCGNTEGCDLNFILLISSQAAVANLLCVQINPSATLNLV